MSTSLAQDVPLPPSHQSPTPQEDAVEVSKTQQPKETAGREEDTTSIQPKIEINGDATDNDQDDGEGLVRGDEKKETGDEAVGESTPTPAVPTLIRPPSPSSRTSTPPLASGSAPKKFSSISINKKFLNKTSSPASGSPSGGTKLGLSSTSPIPTATSSTRLLSTKLTTVPSSKPSLSPSLPSSTSGAAPATSPWAKPAPPPDQVIGTTLQQPAPTRARILTTTPAVMGLGQGIAPALPKAVWKAVQGDGQRAPMGISRDFPTAKEVADGKKEAQLVALAKAAHNQAILQGLNAFTHLDPNAHRWEDEDDDDEMIDFGDGSVYPHHEHVPLPRDPPSDIPVTKSERFVEDFDRSWPRQRPAPELALPKRPEVADRVLFNASSNRLETPSARPPPPVQPTRLMSRETKPSSDRPLPPHMQPAPPTSNPPAQNAPPVSRPLPPHMQRTEEPPRLPLPQERRDPPASRPPVSSTGRQPWSVREPERPQQDLAPQSAAFASANPRRSFSQQARPPIPSEAPAPLVSPSNVDNQTAEMHTAAEKARLRRLAEEQERDAAAERARQKAKELEERFGKKEPRVEAAASSPAAAPPGLALAKAPVSGFTLAQRPVEQPKVSPQALPPRPVADPRDTRDPGSWRRANVPRQEPPKEATLPPALPPAEPAQTIVPPAPQSTEAEIINDFLPPKREHNFDSMLARIQAAIGEARALPSPESEPVEPTPEPVKSAPPVSVEYFNVTQLELPKSPPPAWRTYAVKLPRTTAKRPPIPVSRTKAFEISQSSPRNFIMAFDPPLKHLSQITFSRADLLLPQPIQRRFAKYADSGPIVSISPRRLVPFQRKIKKQAYSGARPDVDHPTVSIESLLSEAPAKPGPPSISIPPASDRWATSADVAPEPPRKSKSPVKTSLAAKAEKDGMFAAQGVSISIPERARALSDAKPGVRFMVSSELEGDSLLDEVNKISLETVGEGFDEAKGKGKADAKVAETPNTPPSLSGPTRSLGTSPNGTTTPWSNPSARSNHHDHVRSVWGPTSSTETPRSEGGYVGPLAVSEAPTPMYPSLNAPSSADPPAPQPLPPTMKMPYSSSQAFSPTTGSYGSRASSSPYGFTSPDPHPQQQHVSAQNAYQRSSVNGSTINGYGMQQAVWSPSAFGTGYGYAKPTVDPKAAYATSKDAYAQQMGNDYRFSAQGAQPTQAYSGYAQSPQQQTFANHQNHHAHGYGRGAHTAQGASGNYGYYGAPGQTGARARANGGEYYAGMESGSGYYGGISQSPVGQTYGYGAAAQAQHQQQQQHAQAQVGGGSIGRGAAAGAATAGRGKMWL